jgi:hypothetical protein
LAGCEHYHTDPRTPMLGVEIKSALIAFLRITVDFR